MTQWLRNSLAGITFVASLATSLHAQLPSMSDVDRSAAAAPAAGPLPEWDVASLKPHPLDDGSMMWMMNADGVSLKNLRLEQMIGSAWDLKPYQISGLVSWMRDIGYDLTAKVSAEDVAAYKKLSLAQRREMMQKLLIDRFQLKFHLETKTLPTYDLIIDKGGPKLKTTTAVDAPSLEEARANPNKYNKGRMMMGPGRYEGTGVQIKGLAGQLSGILEKPVNDTTGLTGLYDITLHFRTEESTGDTGGDNAELPTIFAAVQEQLGLKLVPNKGPVETLIVESAQKPQAD